MARTPKTLAPFQLMTFPPCPSILKSSSSLSGCKSNKKNVSLNVVNKINVTDMVMKLHTTRKQKESFCQRQKPFQSLSIQCSVIAYTLLSPKICLTLTLKHQIKWVNNHTK